MPHRRRPAPTRGDTTCQQKGYKCYIFLLCAHVQLHMPQTPHVLRTALRVIRLKRSALCLSQVFNFCPKKKNGVTNANASASCALPLRLSQKARWTGYYVLR